MNTTELLKFHEDFCATARATMQAKNHDYAGASGDTPFANFEAAEKLGIASTGKGMLIRMLDKLQRLNTFFESGELKVKSENVAAACEDIVNYAILMAARQASIDGAIERALAEAKRLEAK